ncbi:MAG TPA: EEP domain-containing protein [Xanthomonadaceae bacterium]|nr:EEP domain-containing protein [Xanthomonadaceae bacterium]
MIEQSEPRRLRLLSYNIQSGLTTRKYSQYLTRSWKHLVPVPSRMANLDGIARILAEYDIVGLQEVDAGSLRSGFVNQVKYLADYAGFEYVFDQANRKIGMISQHGNAVLSRIRPAAITEHKLPGLIPGRGVLEIRFGADADALHVLILHMALGRRGRLRQIEFLTELVRDYRHVILMGDLNCGSDSPEMSVLLTTAHLREPAPGLYTFPSWRPDRQLDHILVSPSIAVERVAVLNHAYSDHLPIAMEVQLPEGIRLLGDLRLAASLALDTPELIPVEPPVVP